MQKEPRAEVQRAGQEDFEPRLLFHSSSCQAAACAGSALASPLLEGSWSILPKLAEDPAAPTPLRTQQWGLWEQAGTENGVRASQSQTKFGLQETNKSDANAYSVLT